jgi:DNA-binding MarR family transcriptional regulator
MADTDLPPTRAETDGPTADVGLERLLDAERDVQAKLGDQPFDFESMLAISNIYRAAAAVRRVAERTILSDYGISWGGFTILWVLWVWDGMETSRLAAECDLSKGTLTGMVNTLERQGLVERSRVAGDRRKVVVGLSGHGLGVIKDLFPRFNRFESEMTTGLSASERRQLARLLRQVVRNTDEADNEAGTDGTNAPA